MMRMGSRIAPIPAPRVEHDIPPLCDRCAAALVDTGTPDIASFRLRGARIIVDKLAPVGADGTTRMESGLFTPAAHARVRQTYGIEAHVIAVGPAIDPDDVRVGDRVIIDEFGGRALWWGERALPYWIVGDGEIMVVLRREDGDDVK